MRQHFGVDAHTAENVMPLQEREILLRGLLESHSSSGDDMPPNGGSSVVLPDTLANWE